MEIVYLSAEDATVEHGLEVPVWSIRMMIITEADPAHYVEGRNSWSMLHTPDSHDVEFSFGFVSQLCWMNSHLPISPIAGYTLHRFRKI